ncbi:GNAT family N-acetyltransferase [Rubritalea halochordaticola]
MHSFSNITIRPARAADLDWLDPFYESQMRPYVELTHVWDTTKFREYFAPESSSIIQEGGEDIGLLVVVEREDGFYIRDILLKPEWQGRGIGSHLLRQVLAKADRKGWQVRLRVLKGNPAIRLYHRLGFTEEEELENCYQLVRPLRGV